MEGVISVCTGILILLYVGVAIFVIWKRRTLAGTLVASGGFLCGGLVVIPVAQALAAFLCWAVLICLALWVLGAVFGE